MFGLILIGVIVVAAGNLAAVVFRGTRTIGATTYEMADKPYGPGMMRFTVGFAVVWNLLLCLLAFPLRELDPLYAAAWAGVMVVTVCETIYTSRRMWAVVMDGARDVSFSLHDSLPYRAWHVIYSVATIAVCVFLLLPRG